MSLPSPGSLPHLNSCPSEITAAQPQPFKMLLCALHEGEQGLHSGNSL